MNNSIHSINRSASNEKGTITVATGLLTFPAACINAYATPVLLGGAQFQMMAPAVYDQFSRVSNCSFGAPLAFILLAVTLVMTIVGSTALSRKYRSS
ncbi:hypothetical protein JIR23_13905 [Bradyrhizobium diazoefficiens]|nr:hypothetical protein JIR23_13905 [Bradyrhizobium diazoefficiens]